MEVPDHFVKCLVNCRLRIEKFLFYLKKVEMEFIRQVEGSIMKPQVRKSTEFFFELDDNIWERE